MAPEGTEPAVGAAGRDEVSSSAAASSSDDNVAAIRGIYTLANDPVLPWFEPFMASLRDHEPDIPVFVIPYDEQVVKLNGLADRYDFTVWNDPSLNQLDRIGTLFTSPTARRRHNFRKFGTFWGPLDQFMFLDCDIIVLGRIDPMLDVYARAGVDLVYLDTSMRDVYQTDAFRQKMVETHRSVGWNSGTWLSRRGCTSIDVITDVVERSASLRDTELRRWGEQTFLNYVSDVEGWTRSRLSDLDPTMPRSTWARHRANEDEPPMSIVHWAGDDPSPLMPRRRDYLRYRLATLGSVAARARFWTVMWPAAGARVLLSRAKHALRAWR